jgi:hypothetical protein
MAGQSDMSCRGYIFSFVTPAEAGVQGNQHALATLDPGFRRDDGQKTDANPINTPPVMAALSWLSL